ncbi:MAG: hypothetical protein AAF600_06770 [Bacteroidota bacterium]
MTLKELIASGGYQKFIHQKGALVYVMLRKKFPQLQRSESAITEEDVLAYAVMAMLEKYLDEPVTVVEKLLFRTAFYIAVNYFKSSSQKTAEYYNGEEHDSLQTSENDVDITFAEDYRNDLLVNTGLSGQQQFVVDKYFELEYESGYTQKEVVEMIQTEYLEQFKSILTLDNYRQLKKRGLDRIKISI